MTPAPRAALDALAERAANLLAATSGERGALGATWDTTAAEVETARAVLAAHDSMQPAFPPGADARGKGAPAPGRTSPAAHAADAPAGEAPRLCARPIDPQDGGPVIAGVACCLPLPCPVHDARPADVRGDPAAVERAKAARGIADARLRVVAAAEACEVAAVRDERRYWMRRVQAMLDRETAERKALATLVVLYRGNAGEPKAGTPEAADFDRARAWSEDCVVCEEDEPDEPRVAGRERHVYCGEKCAASADCRACLGDGFEGPRENDVPCGECRPGDRMHHEAQQDEDARDREEQRRVDEALGK